MQLNHKKISELVEQNYVYASVLYYFGIEFYNYSEKTLEAACKERSLNVQLVTDSLEKATTRGKDADPALISYPIDLIIAYLKHAHYLFVKKKLPYLAKVIAELDSTKCGYHQVVEDLQFVFPLFVEDFIHHIYEEEDNLFEYIATLDNNQKACGNLGKLYYSMEKFSIQRYAAEHEAHDDEMTGIRRITDNYQVLPNMHPHLRVVYAELQDFETSLITHARVENEILFPKALTLENQVRRKLQSLIPSN